MSSHNNPPITIEIDAKLADFVLDNCDTNIELGLKLLQSYGDNISTAYKLVEMVENFRALKNAIVNARTADNVSRG